MKGRQSKQGPHNMQAGHKQGGQPSKMGSEGRGWHGDSDGHAKAGGQSHKNDVNR